MPKAQPNIQPKAHIFYYFQCETRGFSPLIITSLSEHKKYQFLIVIFPTKTICERIKETLQKCDFFF